MREYRDLVIVGAVFLGALLLSVLLFWLSRPLVEESRELELRSALEDLAGGVELGEPLNVNDPTVRALIPLSGEAAGYLAELSVMGYRDEVRFLVRLDGGGRVERFALLSDSEDPAYDWFLRDLDLITRSLNRRTLPDAVAGATVTVRSMVDGVNAARRILEDL